MADMLDVLELVSKEWKTTNAIHKEGEAKKVFSRREPYESHLARLEEKGLIVKKETSQKVGVKTEWRKKNVRK